MNIRISRETLLKPLQLVSGVVEKRHTMAILSNILLNLSNDRLTLTGTDLEVELTASIPLEGELAEGEITLPARKFLDICKSLPDDSILDIKIDQDRALIRSGKSRFTLATLPATDFPATESITGAREYSVPQSRLLHLLEQTQFCMANQDVRYYLNGLLLELRDGGLRTVATDGHRLALCDVACEVVPADINQIIIPRKGVNELARLLHDSDAPARIQLNSNFLRITLEDVIFTSKLIDGRFPDYERVIPRGGDKLVVANKEVLQHGLQRASILSNDKFRGVRLNLRNNLLQATVNNPEQEEAEEEIDVQYSGDELEIGFNVSYLLDALNAINEAEVQLVLIDQNSSCVLHGVGAEDARYVVMPMRL